MTAAVRQIYPDHGRDLQVAPVVTEGPLPAAVAELAALYRNGAGAGSAGTTRRGPWVRANMVASTDGAVTIGGRSGLLSGPADKMIFGVLRSLSDVILVGAATARAERYGPVGPDSIWQPLRPAGVPVPAIALVSASLDLSGCGRLLTGTAAAAQAIVITTEEAPAERKAAIGRTARIIEAGRRLVDVGAAIGALADLGFASILTEGGPTLLGQLAGAGLLDELCLTTSPVLAAGSAGRIVTGRSRDPARPAAAKLSLAHVLTDDGFLFCRYLRER